jgi:hypothetical protein
MTLDELHKLFERVAPPTYEEFEAACALFSLLTNEQKDQVRSRAYYDFLHAHRSILDEHRDRLDRSNA